MYGSVVLITANGTGLGFITLGTVLALGEGCENTLNPPELKFLLLFYCQIELSYVVRVHSSSHHTSVCSLF